VKAPLAVGFHAQVGARLADLELVSKRVPPPDLRRRAGKKAAAGEPDGKHCGGCLDALFPDHSFGVDPVLAQRVDHEVAQLVVAYRPQRVHAHAELGKIDGCPVRGPGHGDPDLIQDRDILTGGDRRNGPCKHVRKVNPETRYLRQVASPFSGMPLYHGGEIKRPILPALQACRTHVVRADC
jgi:hypothetical protein